MNYLQLCKFTRQECGVQGQGPSTVVGRTGLLKKIVEWVRDADLFVQSLYADWGYLWKEFTDDTTLGNDGITKPSNFGMWDRESFGVARGTTSGKKLRLIDFKEWRENFNVKSNNPPTAITILPNNNLKLSHPADGTYEIYANYWRQPVEMTANDDEPLYSSNFHRIIIAKAKMWFYEDQESFNQYQTAGKEFTDWLNKLEMFAAPGQHQRAQMQSVPMQVTLG